jgi:hypothetical protein
MALVVLLTASRIVPPAMTGPPSAAAPLAAWPPAASARASSPARPGGLAAGRSGVTAIALPEYRCLSPRDGGRAVVGREQRGEDPQRGRLACAVAHPVPPDQGKPAHSRTLLPADHPGNQILSIDEFGTAQGEGMLDM